jgi:hypothetical protein
VAPPVGPADRHEPLPGLFGLPAHLLRKLSPRGRRLAAAVGVLALAAAVVATIVLAPRISESKHEQAAEERAKEARALAAERARLRVEQRPRRGTLAVEGPGGGAPIAALERAITSDALARVRTGELDTPVRRTDCGGLAHEGGRLLLGCTAVTSDVQGTDDYRGVLVGYPYRAALAPATGRYAFCKTSGRPGEGSYTRRAPVELPQACGGPAGGTGPVRTAVTRLYAAAAAQDGVALCRQLAPAWRERLDRRPPRCPAESLVAVLGPGPPRNPRIGTIEIAGARATALASAVRGHGAAERTYRHELELVRGDGAWLVARTRER